MTNPGTAITGEVVVADFNPMQIQARDINEVWDTIPLGS